MTSLPSAPLNTIVSEPAPPSKRSDPSPGSQMKTSSPLPRNAQCPHRRRPRRRCRDRRRWFRRPTEERVIAVPAGNRGRLTEGAIDLVDPDDVVPAPRVHCDGAERRDGEVEPPTRRRRRQ